MVASDPADEDAGLPAGWTPIEDLESSPGKYDARSVSLFEREGADVAVQAFPSEPNVPHSDTDRWRVAVVHGRFDDPDRTDPIADVDGQDAALEVARSFMEAYEAATGPDRVERAMEAVSS